MADGLHIKHDGKLVRGEEAYEWFGVYDIAAAFQDPQMPGIVAKVNSNFDSDEAKRVRDQLVDRYNAMRGISRAKPGSVRRLVEAAAEALAACEDNAYVRAAFDAVKPKLRAALAEIELEDK